MRERMPSLRRKRTAQGTIATLVLLVVFMVGLYSWKRYVLKHDGAWKAEAWLLKDLRQTPVDVDGRLLLPREVHVTDMQPVSAWRFLSSRHRAYDVLVVFQTDLSEEPQERTLRFRSRTGTVWLEMR